MSTEVSPMLGARLRQARKMAGLSQEALAEKAGGITKQAISKYELGKDVPSSGVLLRLSRALAMRPEWLLRPETVRLDPIAFPERSSMSRRELARISWYVRDHVERCLTLERIVLGEQAEEFVAPGALRAVRSPEEAEKAAEDVREEWQLGLYSIANMTAILEERGVRVVAIKGGESFDGLSAWADEHIPVIVVGADWPGDRQRFALARELARLLFDSANDSRKSKKRAHRFARALLVPRTAAYRLLGERRSTLTWEELDSLKHAFGVSIACWIQRATDLGIISQGSSARLWRDLASRGWKRREPGVQVASEQPTRFERLLSRALADGLISESRAAELAGVSLAELRAKWKAHHCVPA